MPTFAEEVQSVGPDDTATLRRRVSARVETVGEAVSVLEEWTEASHETQAELSSKYDTAKSIARDEIRDAGTGEEADALPPEDLLTHPAVSDRTKQSLGEYGTKLQVFLDEERSYEGARERLRNALGAELSFYERLLNDFGRGATVRDAQQAIARFAREETLGPANQTATDVLLESADENDEDANPN